MNKRQRAHKILVPNPSILETIPKEESDEGEMKLDEEEEQVPLQRRTQLAKATELERRKSATNIPSPTHVEMIELSSSEDEV